MDITEIIADVLENPPGTSRMFGTVSGIMHQLHYFSGEIGMVYWLKGDANGFQLVKAAVVKNCLVPAKYS